MGCPMRFVFYMYPANPLQNSAGGAELKDTSFNKSK